MRKLLQEISTQDAYAKFYADIPEDDFNSIVSAAGMNKMCKTLTLLLNAVKMQEIGVQQAIDALNTIKTQGPTAIKATDKLISSGEIKTAQELIAHVNNNELVTKTHAQRSENGLVVLYEDERGRLTCTLTYEANKHYFGGRTKWCTASGEDGNVNGCLMFGYYANILYKREEDELEDALSYDYEDEDFENNELIDLYCKEYNINKDENVIIDTDVQPTYYFVSDNAINYCFPLLQFEAKNGKIFQIASYDDYTEYEDGYYVCDEADNNMYFEEMCELINFNEKEFYSILNLDEIRNLGRQTATYYIQNDVKRQIAYSKMYWEREEKCGEENAILIEQFTENLDENVLKQAVSIYKQKVAEKLVGVYRCIDGYKSQNLLICQEKFRKQYNFHLFNELPNTILYSPEELDNLNWFGARFSYEGLIDCSLNIVPFSTDAFINSKLLERTFARKQHLINKWLKENIGKTPLYLSNNECSYGVFYVICDNDNNIVNVVKNEGNEFIQKYL